jgi:hypothetical protein
VGVRVAVGMAVGQGRAEPICRRRHAATVHAATGHTTWHATTGHADTGSVDVLVHGMVSAEGRCWRRAAMGDGWSHGCHGYHGRHGHACANVGGSSGRRRRSAGRTQLTQGAYRSKCPNCAGWADTASGNNRSGRILSALLFESAGKALLERRCPAPIG